MKLIPGKYTLNGKPISKVVPESQEDMEEIERMIEAGTCLSGSNTYTAREMAIRRAKEKAKALIDARRVRISKAALDEIGKAVSRG